MVRYSRLPFRQLVRSYGVDLVFSPMLISDSFLNSESARDADLRTNTTDGPLIVQFASNNEEDHGKIAQGIKYYLILIPMFKIENNSLFVFISTFRFNKHHQVIFSTEKHDLEKEHKRM